MHDPNTRRAWHLRSRLMATGIGAHQELSRRFLLSENGEEICATVSLSMSSMGPPQRGHRQSADEEEASRTASAELGYDAIFNSCWHSGRDALRRRFARKPKKRMRTKPCGSTWRRKRRRNSSAVTVMSRCLLP